MGRPRRIDYAEVHRLRGEGLTMAAIGERLGVTSQAISYAVSSGSDSAERIQSNNREREAYVVAEKKKGRTSADIAYELRVSRQRVDAIAKRGRRASQPGGTL
jgi:DNA-binding CsgD family transcriptional regulator